VRTLASPASSPLPPPFPPPFLTTRRARPTSVTTDLSHFPLLRDADVMKRASLTCVLRLEKSSLNSQKIPQTFTDKSS